jgi:hypothetical protein
MRQARVTGMSVPTWRSTQLLRLFIRKRQHDGCCTRFDAVYLGLSFYHPVLAMAIVPSSALGIPVPCRAIHQPEYHPLPYTNLASTDLSVAYLLRSSGGPSRKLSARAGPQSELMWQRTARTWSLLRRLRRLTR